MRLPLDVLASLFLGASCISLLAAHRLSGGTTGYRRVVQQGATFFLGFNLMHAGYWMLQPVMRRCADAGVTPSAISWASLVPAFASALAAAFGHWGVAAWLLLGTALLDVLDGAVARATGGTSAAGAVLDSALDRYAEFIFFLGVFIFYRHHLAAQLLVVAALFGSFLISYSSAKAEALRATPPRGSMKRSDRLTLLIVATATAPLVQFWFEPQSELRAWPVLAGVTVIAVLANVSAIRRFAALAQHMRETEARQPDPGINGGRAPSAAGTFAATRSHDPVDGNGAKDDSRKKKDDPRVLKRETRKPGSAFAG